MASGELLPACRADLNIWEAAWCEDDCIVAIASEEPGRARGTGACGADRRRAGPTGRSSRRTCSSDGCRARPTSDVVAVVEAVCSDRLVVAGDLLLIDPAGGEVRRPDTLGVDVAFLSWRADGVLVATGVRGLETVVLEVDAHAGSRRSDGRRARPAAGSSWRRRPSATMSPSRSTPPHGLPSWSSSPTRTHGRSSRPANDGTEMIAIDRSVHGRCSPGPRPTAWRSRAS